MLSSTAIISAWEKVEAAVSHQLGRRVVFHGKVSSFKLQVAFITTEQHSKALEILTLLLATSPHLGKLSALHEPSAWSHSGQRQCGSVVTAMRPGTNQHLEAETPS